MPCPQRPLKLPALRLPGKTRKLSHTGMFATCAANEQVLNDLFRSSTFDLFLADQNSETRAMLLEVRDVVKDGSSLKQAGIWGSYFGLLQTFQRVTEAHDQNLSDAVFNLCELLDRIDSFPHPELITEEVKSTTNECIQFRFQKLYTPDLALAVMCDPRRGFEAWDSLKRLLPHQPWEADALSCLKTRIKVLPDDEQRSILRGYTMLMGGEVHFEEDELASADNVQLREWWQTYRENGGGSLRLLSQRVLERLYSLSPSQAGVERLNSCFKFIQAARQALESANARYLTYLYVNRRLLMEYWGGAKPAAGSFRLGARWPPRAAFGIAALEDAVAEAEIEKVQVTLDASIAALEAAEEAALRAEKEAAKAGPRSSPRLAKQRQAEKRAAKRKRARNEQPVRKAGRAGRALGKEDRRLAKKKRAMLVSSDSESDSDSGDSDSGDSDDDDDADSDSLLYQDSDDDACADEE